MNIETLRTYINKEKDDFDRLKALLKDNPDYLYYKTSNGETLLHVACSSGATDVAKYLLELDPTLISSCDNHAYMPLHEAARAGKKDIVEFLLEKGANLFAKIHSGKTADRLAIENNYHETSILIRSSSNWWGNVSKTAITHKFYLDDQWILTEIFNFQDQMYRAISRNHHNNQECLVVKTFGELEGSSLLKTASAAFKKANGVIPDAFDKPAYKTGIKYKRKA